MVATRPIPPGEIVATADQRVLMRFRPLGALRSDARPARLLPGIDLGTIAGLLDEPSASSAIKKYRAMLEAP